MIRAKEEEPRRLQGFEILLIFSAVQPDASQMIEAGQMVVLEILRIFGNIRMDQGSRRGT